MSIKQFNHEVLGVNANGLSMLMSAHLARLASLTGISAENLLDHHTLFPYITAFLPAKQVNDLRSRLLSPPEDGLKSLAALIHNGTSPGVGLRFCPRCATEEIRRYGESYWHRSHLLPGVLVCHDHCEPLFEVSTTSGDRLALPHDAAGQLFEPLLPQEKMMLVAKASSDQLCAQAEESPCVTYRRMAVDAGYRLNNREVATHQVSRDLAAYYGDPYLTRFSCSFPNSSINGWPGLMIRPSVKGPFIPLKHVLLRIYLEQAPKKVKVNSRKQPGKVSRDYEQIDSEVSAALRNAVAKLENEGKTIKAWDLLREIGAWQVYRHNRQAMPRTKAAIRLFRQSPQCSWQIRTTLPKG